MEIDTAEWGAFIVVIGMALTTLVTRLGGVFIMSMVPINRKVSLFIRAMSGSVLVALLAPIAINGDIGARTGLLATALMMVCFKKPLLAIAAGILMTAYIRY